MAKFGLRASAFSCSTTASPALRVMPYTNPSGANAISSDFHPYKTSKPITYEIELDPAYAQAHALFARSRRAEHRALFLSDLLRTRLSRIIGATNAHSLALEVELLAPSPTMPFTCPSSNTTCR